MWSRSARSSPGPACRFGTISTGFQPLRAIRTGNAIERRTAAQFLSDPAREIDSEVAMAVLIPTLGDEDAGVRAAAALSLGWVVNNWRDHSATVPVAPRICSRRGLVSRRVVWLPCCQTGIPRHRQPRRPASQRWQDGRQVPGPPPPEQLAALKDKSNAVRRRTAKLIYGTAYVTLPPELAAALEDESAEVRTAAAQGHHAALRHGPRSGDPTDFFAMIGA